MGLKDLPVAKRINARRERGAIAVDDAITPEEAAQAHRELLNSSDEGTRVKALRTYYEVQGMLNPKDPPKTDINHLHLNFDSVDGILNLEKEAKRVIHEAFESQGDGSQDRLSPAKTTTVTLPPPPEAA